MKSIRIKFQFNDEEYKKFENLAKNLNISIYELISELLNEGISSGWDALEYEAKKKKNIVNILNKCLEES